MGKGAFSEQHRDSFFAPHSATGCPLQRGVEVGPRPQLKAAASAHSCHPMNGECSCQPGWAGLHCNESCPHDTHGPGCQEHCLCLHGGLCQPDSGLCRCAPGYTVRRAGDQDPGGGRRKSRPPHSSAHRLQGPHCASLCPPDTYGVNCSAHCSCENAIACSPIDGSCVCKEGNGAGPREERFGGGATEGAWSQGQGAGCRVGAGPLSSSWSVGK